MGSNPAAVTVKIALGLINLQFKNAITTAMPSVSWLVWDRYFSSFTPSSFYDSFFSRVKMNSKNCPVPNVWVLIAQLVEPSSTNAEVTGTNPAEDNNY